MRITWDMLVVTALQEDMVNVTVWERDRPRVHVSPWPLLKRSTGEHGSIGVRRDIADDVLVLTHIRA